MACRVSRNQPTRDLPWTYPGPLPQIDAWACRTPMTDLPTLHLPCTYPAPRSSRSSHGRPTGPGAGAAGSCCFSGISALFVAPGTLLEDGFPCGFVIFAMMLNFCIGNHTNFFLTVPRTHPPLKRGLPCTYPVPTLYLPCTSSAAAFRALSSGLRESSVVVRH